MPRIRQKAIQYTEEDFREEIRRRQGACDVMTVRALARLIDMPHTTLGYKLRDPNLLTVEDLRKLVGALKPDPKTMLLLMGYSASEIKKFGGSYEKN